MIKRPIIATICGLACGFICFALASSGPSPLPWPAAVQIILSRTLMGFAIGLSAFTFGHWSVHGIVQGALFSLPLAFGGLLAPDNPQFSKISMLVWTIVLGMIYGLLTEAVTSGLFRARTVPRTF